MPISPDEIFNILSTIPQFVGINANDIIIQPLSGLTNDSYKIKYSGGAFVFRMPAQNESEIDRTREWHNLQQAYALGLSPKPVFINRENGLQLMEYMEDYRGLTQMCLNDDKQLSIIADVLRKLHSSEDGFMGVCQPFSIVDGYLDKIRDFHDPITDALKSFRLELTSWRNKICESRPTLVPSHIDPVPENFLMNADKNRCYLIDWEYSAMADPYWDLAVISNEGRFDEGRDRYFLLLYRQSKHDMERFSHYKILLELIAAAWAVLQFKRGNNSTDFYRYAGIRLDRCETLLRTSHT